MAFFPDTEPNFRQPPCSVVPRDVVSNTGPGGKLGGVQPSRDDTKPTWILHFETRLSLAEDMRFDPAAPQKNTGVGLGYHQFILSTLFSRRFGPLEPYSGAWVVLPVLTSGSPFPRPE